MRPGTVKDWCKGRMRSFDARHGTFDDILSLLAERERELKEARERLESWLQGSRDKATHNRCTHTGTMAGT
jgi:hypothetical protein